MKCGNGIDTHQDIIVRACGIFYYPPEGGDKPCEYFTKCQKWIKKVISEDEEPMELHRQYKAVQGR